jgi:hypothetical protein
MRVGGRLRYSSVTCSRQRRSCGIVSRFAVINRVTDSSNQRRTQDSRLAVSDRANSRIEYFDYDKKGPRLRASSQHTIWTGRLIYDYVVSPCSAASEREGADRMVRAPAYRLAHGRPVRQCHMRHGVRCPGRPMVRPGRVRSWANLEHLECRL